MKPAILDKAKILR